MEDVWENGVTVGRLNTKGCCFLCLKIEDVNTTDDDDLDNVAKCYSMRQLFRHLQINITSVDKILDSSAKVEDHLIKANLCKICGEIISKVTQICQKLEILYLELNYALECIHSQIAASAKDSDLVQEYSRRMTSDHEALSQLAFVDKLRKELARKCLKKRSGHIPIIQVTKLQKGYKRAFKQEQPPSFKDESDGEINCDPPSSSGPYLPDAEFEPSPSSPTPEEIKFNVNPTSEVLRLNRLAPSSSSTNPTLEASSSSVIASEKSLPIEKETRKGRQRLKNVFYSKNETTGMFHCKKCSGSYKSINGVRGHYQAVHLHLKQKFICNQCGKKFKTRKKRYDHELHVHRNANRYPCHLCKKKFKQQICLKIHVDKVHLRKRYFCRFCNSSYACRYQTKAHEKKCTKKISIKLEPEVKMII